MWAKAQRLESMKHGLRSMRSLDHLEKKSVCWGVVGDEVGRWQECYIFQVGSEATAVIPCGRARERTGQQRFSCGPWWAGGWGGKRLQSRLRVSVQPLVSSGVLCN